MIEINNVIKVPKVFILKYLKKREKSSEMIICKNLDKTKAITNLDEWKNACKEEQWKDGRSAKELAKAWINDKGKYLEILIDSKDEFEGIKFIIGSPEYESKL